MESRGAAADERTEECCVEMVERLFDRLRLLGVARGRLPSSWRKLICNALLSVAWCSVGGARGMISTALQIAQADGMYSNIDQQNSFLGKSDTEM